MSLAALLEETGLADDTGANLPERRDTLAAQQRALRERRQKAQMFPRGTPELPLPDGMERVETPRGVFHFDPQQLSADDVARASAAGRENEILGLGPASKADVAARAAAGEPVAAVVERDPRGAEVKAAIATPSTAPAALAEMRRRAAPDSRVEIQPVEKILAERTDKAPPSALARLLAETADENPGDAGNSHPARRASGDQPAGVPSGLAALLAETGEPAKPATSGAIADAWERAKRGSAEIAGKTLQGAAHLADVVDKGALALRDKMNVPMRAGLPDVAPDGTLIARDRTASPDEAREAREKMRGYLREGGVVEKTERAGQFLEDAAAEQTRPDPARDDTVLAKLVEKLAVPLATAVASGPAMPLQFAAQLGEEGRREALAAGRPEKADAALLANATLGAALSKIAGLPATLASATGARPAVDALLGGLAKRLGPQTVAKIAQMAETTAGRRVIAEGLKGVLRGGGEMGLLTAAQNEVARDVVGYDPNRPRLAGVGEAALWGAAGGGTAGAAFRAGHEADAARTSRGPSQTTRPAPEGLARLLEETKDNDAAAQAGADTAPLWRQMSGTDLEALLSSREAAGAARWFVADVRELALGQHANLGGIIAEFDGRGLNVQPAPAKPGLAHVRESTGKAGEVMLPVDSERGGNSVSALRGALTALEMSPGQYADVSGASAPGSIARRLERDGWTATRTSEGLVRLTRDAAVAAAPGNGQIREDAAPVVVTEGPVKRPKLGKPAEAIADAINARPDDHFKPELSKMEGADVDLVSQIARYGEQTAKRDEDFPAFAERMRAKFGDRAVAYFSPAWEAISGERPVRDLVPTENPLQLESAWKRATQWGRLFWEGSADVLRRSGVRSLADAVDRHVDLESRNLAKAWEPIKAAIEPFQGAGGIVRHSRAKLVFDEFEAFYRAREAGRLDEAGQILANAHLDTRQLIAGVQQMFDFTGRENRRLGVRVRDRDGELRPIGFLGADMFPRTLKDDVLAVLRDPSSDPKRWEEMKAELVRNGNVQTREDAAQFAHTAASTETSSDHFGSLEKARRARLPEDWYDYRFEKVVPRYVAQWAERSAQIESFGAKAAITDRDAFDVALDTVKDPELRRYIEATREKAYRVNRLNSAARKTLGNVTSITSALFLSNPYSSLRNLIGGTAQTANQMGLARSLAELPRAWRAIGDAETAGAVKTDVADLLFHDDGSPAVRKGAGVALKLGGFNAAEQFVRAHNFLTAKSFLRGAVREIAEDPTSRGSLQAQAFFRRHGFDAAKLTAENLKGPLTEAFLRGAVREAQGGYRYNQVPLFTDGPLGRLLFQFGKFGVQATRFHAQNVIAPAIRGEEVPVRGAGGKVEMRRVRTLLPLLRSPLVAMGAGALTFALRKALFGIDRPDATWDEVFRTMDADQQRAVELALGHMVSDVVMGGTFGAMSDYTAMLKDAAERSRFKDPLSPPAASILKETGVLAYKLAQQGRLSAQDYQEWANAIVTPYRYGSALAYRFGNAVDADWAAARRHQAEQDRRFVRNAGRRFAEEAGYDMPGVTGGLPRVTENSPAYDELAAALLSGDPAEVRRSIAQRMTGARSEKERAERLRQLRTSALGRQPMKPGGQSGREDQAAFRAWIRRRLDAGDVRRIEDIQRRYFETGRRAGLFNDDAMERYANP